MRTDAAARRSCSRLVLILCVAGLLAVGPAAAHPSPQQADQVIREQGLELTRYADGTYQLLADGVLLEQLVAHLASISGAEFSVAEELVQAPVTIETDRLELSSLLEQLRAFLEANLILASRRDDDVSRVWLTPTSVTAVAADTSAPQASAGAGAQNPAMQGAPAPQGTLPVPTGNEVRAAGYDPNVDMGEYIRNRNTAAAAANAGAAPGAGGQPPGAAGQPPGAAGQPPGAGGQPPGAEGQPPGAAEPPPAAPPIPMDPNALETYFAGDSTTKTYHRLNCIQAMYLPAANKIWFKSRQEAIAAGYTPHEICVAR